jgi:hypothetical protein
MTPRIILIASFLVALPSLAFAQAQPVQGSGKAGTQAGGVLTVQGDPSGTPLPVTGTITSTGAITAPLGSGSTDAQSVAVTAGGTPATGQSQQAGGAGLAGWLSTLSYWLQQAVTTPAKLVDSGGSIQMTIKAASTPPVATDPQIVVGLNPLGNNVTPQYSTNNALATPHMCGSEAHVTLSSADTQLIAASGSTVIYVCDWAISFSGTDNVYLEQATSGTCATLTQLTMTWYGVANAGKIAANPFYRGVKTAAGAQLCVHGSAASGADVTVYYDQY